MARIITMINHKGGVAKTISAANIAGNLAKWGYKTLLIDMDSQANLTQYLDLYDEDSKKTILEVMTGSVDPKDVILPTKYDNLYLLPSSRNFTEANVNMLRADKILPIQLLLKKRMKKEKDNYGYIIIDCPPSVSSETINALVFSDYAIIPVVPSGFSVEGVGSVLNVMRQINEFYDDKSITILGILFTRVEPRLLSDQYIMEEMEETSLPIFDTKIRKSTVVVKSEIVTQLLSEYAPNSNVTKDYEKVTKEIIEMFNNNDSNGKKGEEDE